MVGAAAAAPTREVMELIGEEEEEEEDENDYGYGEVYEKKSIFNLGIPYGSNLSFN